MIWAYILENTKDTDVRSNQPVFLLIKDLGIAEDYIFFDENLNREELQKLLEVMQTEDKLIIRSIEDLADTLPDLLNILQKLSERMITLCSCQEDCFSGDDYLDSFTVFIKVYVSYEKKKQQKGYRRAVADGLVGRPKSKEIEQALSMYKSGNFKVKQIEVLTGVSKSTLYRYLKTKSEQISRAL